MRILDGDYTRILDSVYIYLTPSEAREMADGLRMLIGKPSERHFHVNDDSFEREVIVSIYTQDNFDGFDERSKRLISEGR